MGPCSFLGLGTPGSILSKVETQMGGQASRTRQQRLVTTPDRSAQMSLIRSTNTKPEILVRRTLHSLGYRFRLHVRNLPGTPDIVLPKYRMVIQVKGCFWHGHNCRGGRKPKSNLEYWIPKLESNSQRDKQNERRLRRLGWSVYTVWECQLRKLDPEHLTLAMKRIVGCLAKRHP